MLVLLFGRYERDLLLDRLAVVEQKVVSLEAKTSISPLQMPDESADVRGRLEQFFDMTSPTMLVPHTIQVPTTGSQTMTFQGSTSINGEKVSYSFSIKKGTLHATIQATKTTIFLAIKKKLTDLDVTFISTTTDTLEFEAIGDQTIQEILGMFGVEY